MDVNFTDEQQMLRDSARERLASECPISLVRDLFEDPIGDAPALWASVRDAGWTGLAIPEREGGVGLGWVEFALLQEELGRVLAPIPFLSTLGLVAPAILGGGSAAQRARLLPSLASGEIRAAFALDEDPAAGDGEATRAEPAAAGVRLTGRKRFVADAQLADWILVAAQGVDGPVLARVDRGQPGVELSTTPYVDGSRKMSALALSGVEVAADDVFGGEAIAAALDHGRIALAAECCGGAARALDLSVAFAKTREQFGKPIGSFQAIQHKCADMLIALESARSAVYYAAWSLSEGEPDAHEAALMAKSFCCEAYARIAGEAIQIHGGLGFSWEQDPHLYYKRAKASELALGDAAELREEIAREIIDGESAFLAR